MQKLFRFVAFPLLLHAAGAHGGALQSTDLLSEEAYLGDIPTVLTVSRLAQPISDAPAAVTVIDRDTIRAAGVVDLADIFRLVPGMYVGHNAGYFHTVNPTVSYHGMTDAYARRMQVLIDGRSVYSPLYGGVAWSDLPLAIEDIDRIEVTRGPNAASYGANSFLGVINIVTQHALETVGNTVSATTGHGRHDLIYRHGGKYNDLAYRVSVGYRNDHGLEQREDDKRTGLLSFRADYQLSERDQLELQFGYNGGDRKEGNLAEDDLMFLPRTKQVYNHFQSLRWQRTLGQESDLAVRAYHSYEKSDDDVVSANLLPLIPIAAVPHIYINNDVSTERYDLEAQHSFSPARSMRLVWGGSLRLDRSWAPMYFGNDKTQDFRLGRLFGHLEWRPLDRLLLNAGAMMEHNDLTGTDTTPRGSANLTIAPGHTLRAGISQATRTPTYLEENFNWRVAVPTTIPGVTLVEQQFLDPGGLSPERITSREIGYLGTFGPLALDGRFFHDHLNDLITQYKITPLLPLLPPGLVPITNSTLAYRNGGHATVHGFEAQGQLRLGSHTRAIANYSHVRISGTDVGKDFTSSMPVNSVSLLATHRFGNLWSGSLAYYYNGVACMMGDGNCVQRARWWDMRLARSFDAGRWHGEVSGYVHNLFDNDYQEFATYNTMSRRAFLNLRLDF